MAVARNRFEELQVEKTGGGEDCVKLMAPISPTPPALIEEALNRIAQDALVSHGATIIDLGCGDGRWLISAAEFFAARGSATHGKGYDLDTVLLAKAREAAAGITSTATELGSTVQFDELDLMLADVSGATLVIAYLFREGIMSVMEKLEREMAPSKVGVLSIGFALKSWGSPKWTLRIEGSVPCYFYSPPWRQCSEANDPAP